MNIQVVLEGKLKETFFKEGVNEFKKRIMGYVDIKILEVPSVDDFIKTLKTGDYVITMEIEGQELSSTEFSKKIQEIEKEGFYNKIVFLIGGSLGLSPEARKISNFKFSMSKLTFLHQEAVLILVEQIYRAIKILRNETYHK